jgi:hypothetical protein
MTKNVQRMLVVCPDGCRKRAGGRYIAQMNAPLVPVPADSLVAAYAATDFLVLALRPVTLRVDQMVAGLDDWLRAQRCESAVVISARSPFSQVLAEEEEDRRHEELRALVERAGLRSAPAVGRPREGTWKPERCICVLDLADDLAMGWMRRFEQYAVVVAVLGQGCRLRWHPDLGPPATISSVQMDEDSRG